MPIYEFFCPGNGKIYSFFARSLAYSDKLPRCPDNPRLKMERMLSAFAVTGRAKDPAQTGSEQPDINDAKLESAMREMEREFAGAGDAEPDPKQLARMMRKLSDLTGENLPEPMKEMIARMEKGEDPEKLEADYGDLMDEFDAGDAGEAPETKAGDSNAPKRRKINRDPTLYEMADYVD
jgi:hypothetical protein